MTKHMKDEPGYLGKLMMSFKWLKDDANSFKPFAARTNNPESAGHLPDG